MNYNRYYTGPDKITAQTFRVHISGHLLAGDDEVVLAQSLNVRATSIEEAYSLSGIIRDIRLNRLNTTTTVTDIYGHSPKVWTAEPGNYRGPEPLEPGIRAYAVTVTRVAGANPLTGVWSDYAEDHLTIHASNGQDAHRIANFISALAFSGQERRTVVDGLEHLDERF